MIDLIEKLHKYEGLEHHSVKFAFFGSLEEHCLISCRVSWVVFDKLVDLILVVVEWVTCGKFESEYLGSKDKHTHKNNQLIDTLSDNVSPHCSIDNLSGLSHWLAVQKSIMGWLSSKSKGSESVHDEINPKHLHGGEGWVFEND